MIPERIDLRAGYRIEVLPTILPRDQWAATLHERRQGKRVTYRKVGPHVLAASPEAAARDLLTAINEGLLSGVEVVA